MSLWIPAADPSAVETAAGLADRLTSGLSPEAPKLASLVTSGWSGQAATAAATDSSKLGTLLNQFCDRMNEGARAMHEFASTYRTLRARFVHLSEQHDAALRRQASLDSAISGYGGRELTDDEQTHRRRLESDRGDVASEIRQLEHQHQTAKDDLTAAQHRAAGQLDNLTPAGVNGDFAHQSAQIKALVLRDLPTVRYEDGRRLGEQIRRELHDHGVVTEDQIAALAAHADDPDFVRGLYQTLGASGVAALSREARNAFAGGDDHDRAVAERLRSALATSFTTAANEHLITDEWLDRFDPKDAYDLHSGEYSPWAEPSGFRADLLIPLLQDRKLPSQVLEGVGNRLFADLRSGMESGTPQPLDKWGAYVGDDPSDPYERNLARSFLGILSHDPEASNSVLLRNFDTLQHVGRGDLIDDVTDKIRDNLTQVVHAGVLGIADLDHDGHRDTGPGAKGFMGDALMARIVLDTADHPDDHYEDFYRSEIGKLVTTDRYFNDAMYSVTAVPPLAGPVHGDQWLDWDGRSYRDGIELDRSAWAAVHQEVMADPGTAATIIAKTRAAMEQASIDFNSGKVPDPNNPGGTMADPQIRATAGIARNAMHEFLMDNLDHASGRLEDELQAIQDREHGTQEAAHGALSTIIGWATNPTEMPQDVLTKVGEAGGNAVIDGLIHQHYANAEASAQSAIDQMRETRLSLHPDRLNDAAHAYADGAAAYAGDPGLVADITVIENGHPVVHTGDPQPYIDRCNTYDSYSHQPVSADFRGSDGHPIAIEDMNSAQLQAYEAWLHDPAVQKQAYQNNAALRDLGN